MKTPRFQIGDTVLVATFECCQKWAECPECNGDKFVTVKAGRNPEVSIQCELCKNGAWQEPSGLIPYLSHVGRVKPSTIVGVAVDGSTIEYRAQSTGTNHSLTYEQEQLFSLEEKLAAIKECSRMAEEAEAFEQNRIKTKHTANRTWAWNASYHRKEIADAKRRLEYNTAALEVALKHKKEESK